MSNTPWVLRGWARTLNAAFGPSLLSAGLLACSGSTDPSQVEDGFDLVLRPESTLVSKCFGWPQQEFSATNNTGGVGLPVSVGEHAIEFSLRDPSGTRYTFSKLLETRPVLLVFGGFT
ncbi:MAG: hypothetical protein ABIF09_02575 [Gemmatimonadota bacterium]